MFYAQHLFFCNNLRPAGKRCCSQGDAAAMAEHAKQRLLALQSFGPGKVRVSVSGCMGRCQQGPALVIYPQQTWYTYRGPEDIDRIIDQAVVRGQCVEDLLLEDN